MIRNIVLSSLLAFAATSLFTAPAFAGDKKVEMKCDKEGKSCKDGMDCKMENCKIEKK